jgi:hypothetical protein
MSGCVRVCTHRAPWNSFSALVSYLYRVGITLFLLPFRNFKFRPRRTAPFSQKLRNMQSVVDAGPHALCISIPWACAHVQLHVSFWLPNRDWGESLAKSLETLFYSLRSYLAAVAT